MKTLLIHTISLLSVICAHAQLSVWDQPLTEILVSQNKAEHSKQTTLMNNQYKMTATQVLAKQQADNFEQKVSEIHKRFTNMMALLSDAGLLSNVVTIAGNIYNDEAQLLNISTAYPVYAPIVLNEQIELVTKATRIIELTGAFVYIGTDLTQMDAADRHTIIQYTLDKFQAIQKILDGTIASINQCINQTIHNPLNVWKGYVNKDKAAFSTILQQAQHF